MKSGNSKGFISDYAIIGFGISGAMIAKELVSRGLSFVVFDVLNPNSSSRVAAGVMNPLVYRRFAPLPRVSQYLLKARSTYHDLEKLLGLPLLHILPFLKLFDNLDERHKWQLNAFEPGHEMYMKSEVFEGNFEGSVRNDFGAGEILNAGWLDLPLLLDSFREYLNGAGVLFNESIEDESLEYSDELTVVHTSKGAIRVKNVIWCNGIKIRSGAAFSWLPFKNSKGETLEIRSESLSTQHLFHKGVFVLPRKGVHYVGATYNWEDDTLETTDAGKEELLGKLNKFVSKPYKIIAHRAGLRPATKDRKPFLGAHPELKRTFIFNGMGSRGVLWAPLLAEELIDFIEHETPLPVEVDIRRYLNYYIK